jgi:hypothetical protein
VLGYKGIGTASGASFAYANVTAAMGTVANANAVNDAQALAWITTPTIAQTLKSRFISSANVTPIWEGAIPEGEIQGVAAVASNVMPTGTALFGDFSSVAVVEYPGGMQLEFDPSTGFKNGCYGVKLTMYLDIVMKYPTSFFSSTGIT